MSIQHPIFSKNDIFEYINLYSHICDNLELGLKRLPKDFDFIIFS